MPVHYHLLPTLPMLWFNMEHLPFLVRLEYLLGDRYTGIRSDRIWQDRGAVFSFESLLNVVLKLFD